MEGSPERKNIDYVQRSPAFLERIEAPCNELKGTGDLIPFASTDVRIFKETESNMTRSASR
jgi:hypothetical protein